jgi:glucokinase
MTVPPPGRPKAGQVNSPEPRSGELPSPPSTGRGAGGRSYVLCADIGGTHARLALAKPGTSEPIAEKHYASADYSGLAPILSEYLASTSARPSAACLAVAGPIAENGQQARLTNLPWLIDAAQLARQFNIPSVRLVNDFAAAAMGVTAANEDTLVTLQAGSPLPTAPQLVIGAGTGLGMALLIPEDKRWRVLPGEGGHIGLSPQNTGQLAIWHALHDLHGRVTAERAISGPGLTAIHRILTGQTMTPEEIAHLALVDDNLPARQSIDMFLEFYGAIAGDMAMLALARGGVFLAGGIAPKLLPLFAASPFLAAFNAKAEHEALARQMPVRLVADPQLGLKGAALLAGP